MRVLFGLMVAVALAGFAGPGRAWDGAACLQRQLNALGYNVGAVDGRIGPATRAGLARYEAVAGKLEARDLTQATAIIHCRKLGLRHVAARRLWSAKAERFVVLVQEGTSAARKSALRQGLLLSIFDISNRTGYELGGSFVAILGTDTKAMLALAKEHIPTGFGQGMIRQDLKRLCDGKTALGISYPGLILVCYPDEPEAAPWPVTSQIRYTAMHEAVHEAQWQLTGSDASLAQPGAMGLHGPIWLIEGVADYMALGGMTAEDGADALREVKRLGGKDRPALQRLERPDRARKAGALTYQMGRAAVWYLVFAPPRPKAPLAFYDHIGSGMTWPDAFERAFGNRPEVFYKSWERALQYVQD